LNLDFFCVETGICGEPLRDSGSAFFAEFNIVKNAPFDSGQIPPTCRYRFSKMGAMPKTSELSEADRHFDNSNALFTMMSSIFGDHFAGMP
jgi:hypothetical protein